MKRVHEKGNWGHDPYPSLEEPSKLGKRVALYFPCDDARRTKIEKRGRVSERETTLPKGFRISDHIVRPLVSGNENENVKDYLHV